MSTVTKRVLFVSPHFPPINAPDHQRVRMALPYLKDLGWEAVVLTVDPQYVEGVYDAWLNRTVPSTIRVVRTRALPAKWTRRIGLGSLALRALPFLWRTGNELLREGDFDLIFFSTTAFPVLILGPVWKRKWGTPYAVDYQDPWNADYYQRTKNKPPGGHFKYWFSSILCRVIEPRAVRDASGFVVVSDGYRQDLISAYPFLRLEQFSTIPFGAPENDFQIYSSNPSNQPSWAPGFRYIVYAGAAGPFMERAIRLLFSAIVQSRRHSPKAWETLRLKFIGTSYAPTGRAKKVIQPIAEEFGVADLVEEQTDRLPYFEALSRITEADGLLIIGSESPSYSPSKIFPYILARRPILAILHRESAAARVVRLCRAGTLITFDDDGEAPSVAPEAAFSGFLDDVNADIQPNIDWSAFSNYSAREMTRQLCSCFSRFAKGNGAA